MFCSILLNFSNRYLIQFAAHKINIYIYTGEEKKQPRKINQIK